MSVRQTTRQRQRIACDPCRERKRKCDGERPCNMCIGYGYRCAYRSTPRTRQSQRATRRSQTEATQDSSPSISIRRATQQVEHQQRYGDRPESQIQQQRHGDEQQGQGQHDRERGQEYEDREEQHQPSYLTPIESNSGAAFVRLLTMTLESSDQSVSPMRMLAWNLFLGERQTSHSMDAQSIIAILSESEMHNFATFYFEKFHPCYGFVDRRTLAQGISKTWAEQDRSDAQDAVLCGVAAIGSLFSDTQDLAIEQKVMALAKRLLDPSTVGPPSIQVATAWVLRTVYLRLTAKPEEAWLASCTSLHIIDAAGSMSSISQNSAVSLAQDSQEATDLRRRMFGVAQHLNIWMSYDLGRRRVVLPDLDTIPLITPPGEYTDELLGLLPYSEVLDPANKISAESLVEALVEVLDRSHTEPPSVLAQCNLMLCIHRRLHSSKIGISESVMFKVLSLMQKSVEAVHSAIARGLPWHHVANIPFQLLCTLLVMDTVQSFALLSQSLACIIAVNEAHRTEATREAVTAACTLLQLHRKRREDEIQKHSNMLSLYPLQHLQIQETQGDLLGEDALQDFWWFNEFVAQSDLATSFAGIDMPL